MKQITLLFIGLLSALGVYSQGLAVDKVFKAGPYPVYEPAFSGAVNIKGDTFRTSDLLKSGFSDDQFSVIGGNVYRQDGKADNRWEKITATDKLFAVNEKASTPQIGYALFFVDASAFVKGSVSVTSKLMLEVYIDGDKVSDKYSSTSTAVDAKFTFTRRQHQVLVKYLIPKGGADSASLAIKLVAPEKSLANLSLATDKRLYTINDVLEGVKVASVSLSPSGKYARVGFSKVNTDNGSTRSFSQVIRVEDGSAVQVPTDAAYGDWMPNGSRLYWVNASMDNALFVYDLESGQTEELGRGLPVTNGLSWAPNEKFFVYTKLDEVKVEEKGPMVHVVTPEDRQPGWRNRYFLYRYDLQSGLVNRLTYGSNSTYLNGISTDSKQMVFSVSTDRYTERPFSVTSVYRLNLENNAVDTLLKDQKFIGRVELSPDQKKLLVLGGPEAFGKVGQNVKKSPIANSYDNQAFIYTIENGSVLPFTKSFDPSIDHAVWSGDGKYVVMMASKGDRNLLYRYSLEANAITEVPTSCDVMVSFDLSKDGDKVAYFGQNISYPFVAYASDMNGGGVKVLADPSKAKMGEINLGQTADWIFKSKDGYTIDGRYYLPPNFDSSKKYPLIVYYYGGTTPVERTFEGRYPFHLYAAMGYVVYVLQPSGATGYGQEFSARHVNAWGKYTADEIIEGAKRFIAEHPYVDAKKVGCIGASYGGFMTQYLQTRTDMFAAAISHAGISDITSYWGEGYWGYSYSSGASANSYPWNNRDLFVGQSPLFSADKVKTPILFLHGQVDTNVPIGESIQMYTALKLLGKTAELVTVKEENHAIAGYKARIAWNNTIFAWFAKYLKGEDEWWQELYPKNNL